MGGTCSTHRKIINVYTALDRKSEGYRPLGRPRRRWDDNMHLRGTGWEVVNSKHVTG
jgi:hypothetical protein